MGNKPESSKEYKKRSKSEFWCLMLRINEARTLQEIDKIIAQEIETLKGKRFSNLNEKQMREYAVRLLYCEMLGSGTSVEFGYRHCATLTGYPDALLHTKRTGYIAMQNMVSPENNLLCLASTSMHRDLRSRVDEDVCCALSAMVKLHQPEFLQNYIDEVETCITLHDSDRVRHKAFIALHAFWKRTPSAVPRLPEHCLENLHYSRMRGSILDCLMDLVRFNALVDWDSLLPSLLRILQQLMGDLNTFWQIDDMFVNIKLLRLLGMLCHGNLDRSRMLHELLEAIWYESVDNKWRAVECELVNTIMQTSPTSELSTIAKKLIRKFLTYDNPNLVHLGNTLARKYL
eukprot:TRINITY_DN4847_c0_g1_i1.p1 TRINITY_DN4847_c0_g1~~TRINITY_DN4847_c0_g1_i1.p1  ORF type:complete len:361 (+),score=31.24 TRINITY_DN4847_c0_g1_i1:49-1083(+)